MVDVELDLNAFEISALGLSAEEAKLNRFFTNINAAVRRVKFIAALVAFFVIVNIVNSAIIATNLIRNRVNFPSAAPFSSSINPIPIATSIRRRNHRSII